MSFYERLDSLLRQKNISQRRMIIDFGLGKNTMFNWKHRNNIPNGEVLLKLSEYLDVSVDYLLSFVKQEKKIKRKGKKVNE